MSLIDSWRADSESFSMALARNYPMCENAVLLSACMDQGEHHRVLQPRRRSALTIQDDLAIGLVKPATGSWR